MLDLASDALTDRLEPVNPNPTEDSAKAYHQAERRLRELLLGDGAFTPGIVKGEERRLELTRLLRRMREAFDAAAVERERGRLEVAEARIAYLESELRKVAAARSRDRSDVEL